MRFAHLHTELEALACFHKPWFIAGGWAIDLFVGRETRTHQDVDIAIFREDQFELRRCLSDWRWQKVVQGALVDWAPGDRLELPVHELHADKDGHRLKFLLSERLGNYWVDRRNPVVTRSLAHFQQRSALPFLPAEIVLLYKSAASSPNNHDDFRAALPRFKPEARRWLSDAIGKRK